MITNENYNMGNYILSKRGCLDNGRRERKSIVIFTRLTAEQRNGVKYCETLLHRVLIRLRF